MYTYIKGFKHIVNNYAIIILLVDLLHYALYYDMPLLQYINFTLFSSGMTTISSKLL